MLYCLVMNRDKSFKKYSLKSINGLRHYKTAIEKNAIGSYIIWQFSETMKLHSRLLPPPSNCRPLLNILLAFTMVKKKKKKAMNCGMPLIPGERFWIEQLSRGQAKMHSPLRIRSFLWGRNRNSEEEFMELGRYNRRLKREDFSQGGGGQTLQKRMETLHHPDQQKSKSRNSCWLKIYEELLG